MEEIFKYTGILLKGRIVKNQFRKMLKSLIARGLHLSSSSLWDIMERRSGGM